LNARTSHTLIIDVSNVCRDAELSPVGLDSSWSRLQLLLDAIDRDGVVDYSGYYLVADRTLRGRLDSDGKRSLRDAERAGHLELKEFADERLVELAFGADSPFASPILVTNDFLDDFRRTFPELDSAEAVAWTVGAAGEPRPALRPFGTRTHHRVSKKEEEGELRRRQLLRRNIQEEAARWYYRCASKGCVIAAFWPDHIEELPKYEPDTSTFVCPSCSSELERGEPRLPAVLVIVYKGDREAARLLVETGIDIGRRDDVGCIGLDRFLSADDVAAVSRRHLRIHVDGDRVLVEDLGSKNGTVIQPRVNGRPEQVAQPNRTIGWGLRDALVLPGEIRLERSGRRLPYSGEQPLDRPPDQQSSTETRMITPGQS